MPAGDAGFFFLDAGVALASFPDSAGPATKEDEYKEKPLRGIFGQMPDHT